MKKCLIVDDSMVIRKIIRKFLEAMGFECHEAEDGKIALDFCLKTMPDIVMLDWNMPVMDGLEFLKKLRVSAGGQQPTVIFCTTENDMTHIQMALESGANDYIMKPFDEEIIRSKFEQNNLITGA